MAIPYKNVLGNPNVTEGTFQIAIEQLRESVIGSGKEYDVTNTYMQYDTCIKNGITFYSKTNSNTGNAPSVSVEWGLIGDLFNLLITNGTALGYGTGSGGTVTQLTSKSTSVTLNKPTGQITMNDSTLVAGASVAFQLVNSSISVNDTLVCNLLGISYLSGYSITCVGTGNGYAYFSLKNNTVSNLSEAVQFGFSVVKGAVA